jgi:hypothetical protein
MNVLDKLKNTNSSFEQERILKKMMKKNKKFFRKHFPSFLNVLETTVQQSFDVVCSGQGGVNIYEQENGQFCHPPNQLLEHSARLGHCYHNDWIDEVRALQPDYGDTEMGESVRHFIGAVGKSCPGINTRVLTGKMKLPVENDRPVTGPVVFLGIFHGLHITSFLANATPSHILLIEPDTDAFIVSCHFLDYAELHQRFSVLNISVGGNISDKVMELFFYHSYISSRVWVRFLPVYHSEVFTDVVNKMALKQKRAEGFLPGNWDVDGLGYGLRNLQQGIPVLCHKAAINCPVVVVGSGPSLADDLAWLRENQQKVIIICATNVSRILRFNEIKPDFQILMDIELTEQQWEKIDLGVEIPTIFYYKVSPEIIAKFKAPVLIVDKNKPMPVDLTQFGFEYTHPTSGNLAMTVATIFSTELIVLTGMDLGSWGTDDHAANMLNQEKKQYYQNASWMTWPYVNFEQQGQLFKTQPGFLSAKIALEKNIQKHKTIRFVNFSNGIKIEGTESVRSSEMAGLPNFDKGLVLNKIEKGLIEFSPQTLMALKFPKTTSDLMGGFKAELLTLFSKQFDWESFVYAMDKGLNKVFYSYFDEALNDWRVFVFIEKFNYFLTVWYRMMIFTESVTEANTAYQAGRKELNKIIELLEFPLVLKDI